MLWLKTLHLALWQQYVQLQKRNKKKSKLTTISDFVWLLESDNFSLISCNATCGDDNLVYSSLGYPET